MGDRVRSSHAVAGLQGGGAPDTRWLQDAVYSGGRCKDEHLKRTLFMKGNVLFFAVRRLRLDDSIKQSAPSEGPLPCRKQKQQRTIMGPD